MRFPYVINSNTKEVYTPSTAALELLGEIERRIFPEKLDWGDDHKPTLAELCLRKIAQIFEDRPDLDKLTGAERDNLLEIISTDLPLELVIPLITDEIYWKRRYAAKFGIVMERLSPNWTWKGTYIQRHMQEMVEQAQPQYNDEDNMADICKLCSPYVRRIIVSQLQAWIPPLTMMKDDIPEVYPLEHINFQPILVNLPDIEELGVVYGMNRVGENFNWNMFKLTALDCKRLANAVLSLKHIKILRLHRSKIEDEHAQALMQGLIKNETLIELDLSHCNIGDNGALCISKVIMQHPTLEILILCNNRIKAQGGRGIGFALLQESCCPLKHLDLRLNPLEHEGVMGILRSVIRGEKPKILNLSGCAFGDDTPIRLGQMLNINRTLEVLDVSSNWLGSEGGEAVISGLQNNRVLQWLDLRETNIPSAMLGTIRKLLERNRGVADDIEEPDEDIPEVQTEEILVQVEHLSEQEENSTEVVVDD